MRARRGRARGRRRTEEVLARGQTGPVGIVEARPSAIEASAVQMAADLALEVDASLYVVHLSSVEGLAQVRAARERGARVLAETCPQYLFLTDDVLRRPPETAQDFLCTPPVRTSADRSALWEGLAAGDLDAVATDHCPFTMADRRRGVLANGWRDFTQIPGGLPGIETRASLVYQAVREGRLSLERWIEVVASTPARLFGLGDRKGRLEPRPGRRRGRVGPGRDQAARGRVAPHAHRPQPIRVHDRDGLARAHDLARHRGCARRRARARRGRARAALAAPLLPGRPVGEHRSAGRGRRRVDEPRLCAGRVQLDVVEPAAPGIGDRLRATLPSVRGIADAVWGHVRASVAVDPGRGLTWSHQRR